MKTLDEVIAELEDEGLFADALHYLKAYQEMVDGIVNIIVQYKETFKMIIEEYEDENAR